MEIFYSIGGRIKLARRFGSESQKGLARKLGISEKTMVNYESEDTPVPAIKLVEIAKICGISEVWLLTGKPIYFVEWVIKYWDDDDIKGYIADAILTDPTFPRKEKNYKLLYEHVQYMFQTDKIEAFIEIWKEYQEHSESIGVNNHEYITKDEYYEAVNMMTKSIQNLKAEMYDFRKEIDLKNEELRQKDEAIEALFAELGKNLLALTQIEELRRKYNL